MAVVVKPRERSSAGVLSRADTRFLRVVLGAQVVAGLVWGISMVFFAPVITLADASGPHIEKIALEGGAHFMLVLGAVLAWRAPSKAGSVLLLMIFLNAVWALTDLVYIPLFHLTAFDFTAKLLVNGALAIGLAIGARRAASGTIQTGGVAANQADSV